MQVFTVHYRSEVAVSASGLAEGALFVKEGFSWPAFAIPLVWLIYKRMWWVLAGFAVLQTAVTGAAGAIGLSDSSALLFSLAFNLILGLEGNELYRWSLDRRRYRLGAIVTGSSQEEAEHRFFSAQEKAGTTT